VGDYALSWPGSCGHDWYTLPMNCPLGHGALQPETHGAIEVQACSNCGGEWLAHETFAGLEASAVADSTVLAGMVEYQPNQSDLPCPVCEKPMYEFDYRGNPLELNACELGHGYWLDGGEESRVRELMRQRARDLHRSAAAEGSFGSFLNGIRGQLGGRGGKSRR
jgi:Zn-finger nucleic acid-binding protein